MKKIGIALCSMAASALLAGCSLFGGGPRRTFSSIPEKTNLSAPSVISVGRTLYWGEVADATSYSIYDGDLLIDTTEHNFFTVPESAEDKEYSVVATGDGYGSSSPSDITVWKSTGFLESEILDLSESKSFSGDIAKEIRLVKFGQNKSSFHFYAQVEARVADLYVEMENVKLDGSIYLEDGTHSYLK